MLSHRRELSRGASARSGEQGASLIFALVFVIVIFTILTAVLSFAFAANKNVSTFRRDQALHYAADAALEVGVQIAKDNPRIGETGSGAPCSMSLPVASTVHDPRNVFASGAVIRLTCAQTTVSTGPIPADDVDGGQHYRDITFNVECRLPATASMADPLQCGGTGNPVVIKLGSARVRYDIDTGYKHPTTGVLDPDNRARVPKIVSWEINR